MLVQASTPQSHPPNFALSTPQLPQHPPVDSRGMLLIAHNSFISITFAGSDELGA